MSTLKVNTILSETPTVNITDGLNVTGVSTVAALNTTSIVNDTPLSNRNKVINGGMVINQRANSYTATGGEYILDRFQHASGSSFTFDTTTTQDSSTPDGFSKSLKITPDQTQTPTGSHNGTIRQMIEGQDLQDLAFGTSSAKSVTISFYAKSASSNNNHQYGVQLRCRDGSTTQYVSQAFTVTSSWQRFTMTFVGNTGVAIRNDTENGFEICFHLTSGSDDIVSAKSTWTTSAAFQTVTGQSNFMDNTSNEFYLTGVQLEVGSVATPFEHRSFGDELERCRRYLQIIKGNDNDYTGFSGYSESTTVCRFPVYFRPPMRSDPTLSVSGTLRFQGATNDSANFTSGLALQQINSTFDGASIQVTGTSGMGAADRPGNLQFKSSGSFISFDAEF